MVPIGTNNLLKCLLNNTKFHVQKSKIFDYPRSIYHSMRLDFLITNMYGSDMFGLKLNELLGV